MELQQKVKSLGIMKAVMEITGLEEGSEVHKKIVDAYQALQH